MSAVCLRWVFEVEAQTALLPQLSSLAGVRLKLPSVFFKVYLTFTPHLCTHTHTHTHTHTQYGFVNSALEKLIKRRFGVEKWDEIRYVYMSVCMCTWVCTCMLFFFSVMDFQKPQSGEGGTSGHNITTIKSKSRRPPGVGWRR